eukprot:TRINITY_DN2364_c0_g2_i5.p1 TRINITY_DN2364_c0_g2~~TRINITY_DN2364_c0_g2_i5.p1  ORF type:complete len:449 (+),score=82.02 TRINITY_DN2364_c0_g2_i5:133-1479(+)
MFQRALLTLLMIAAGATVGVPPLPLDETSGIDAGIGARSGSMENGFVITWVGTLATENGAHGIYAQGYSNDGSRLGEKVVLCTLKKIRSNPVICGSHHSDKFFVVYQLGDGIYFTEGALTEEGIVTLVNHCPSHLDEYHETHHHFHMSLACRTDGGMFALAYSEFHDKQTTGVKLMLWNSSTFDHYEPPEPISVSPVRASIQCNPDVAILSNGNVVVVWQDIHSYSINGQLLTSGGSHIGVPFQASSMVGFESNPTVEAFNTNSGFLVGWKDMSGTVFPMVVGGRVYFPTTYVQVFTETAQKACNHWMVGRNDDSGNILSMAVTENDAIWISWIEGTNLNGCKYSPTGSIQLPGCFSVEATVHRGYNNLRLGMSPLLGEGFVLTTGRGRDDPVATFWYSEFLVSDDALPETDDLPHFALGNEAIEGSPSAQNPQTRRRRGGKRGNKKQ